MTNDRLLPAAVFGGLLALGVVGGGALVGQGVIHARAGDRTVRLWSPLEPEPTAGSGLLAGPVEVSPMTFGGISAGCCTGPQARHEPREGADACRSEGARL